MPIIKLECAIKAPVQRVFDLSRSIDFHQISTAQTKEKAIAGVTSGLIKLGETVTWRARHKGIWMNLQSTISVMEEYSYFVDEQVKGPFKHYRHEHYFEEKEGVVIMKDVFDFESPLGVLGRIANKIIAYSYLKDLLIRRNDLIKEYAEGELWREILEDH